MPYTVGQSQINQAELTSGCSRMGALVMQVASAEEFAANVKGAGSSCELHIYEGAGHAFLNNPDSKSHSMS